MGRASLGRDYFARIYAATSDPWNFSTSAYEHEKYRATIAALGGRCFARAFEIGCSIGVLTSMLAAHLHFGQISPVEIALRVNESSAPAEDREAFLEELIIRRELAMNFALHQPQYDQFAGLPSWARQTLKDRSADDRAYVYSRQELEEARTHDPYWNAAQKEMILSGYMHNMMRMYWGKKILEWKRTPQEAYGDALFLNNKYFLCGRDPASYANIGWLFGLHDRPWAQRKIFGTVRYMNAAGLERKFDMPAYLKMVENMEVEMKRLS